MIPAAAVTPLKPNGAKSARLSESQPWIPSRMNITRTPILISTMIALVLADSLAPRISSSVHRKIRMTAGKLSRPSAHGREFAHPAASGAWDKAVSYTHLRAHETDSYLVCRLLLETKKTN